MYKRLLVVALVLVSCFLGWRLYTNLTAFDVLARAPHNQYVGAREPTVIITEVMDYRCPACRDLHEAMSALVARHPEVRVIYRVYPIFGAPAIHEGKMAMAAGMQGKFEEMHNKLISRADPITPDEEKVLIGELGLEPVQYEKDRRGATWDMFFASAALEAIDVRSTPTLIVEGKIFPAKNFKPTVESLEELLADYLLPAVTPPSPADASVLNAPLE